MSIVDKWTFEGRGGHGGSNSHYVLHRTTCCGSYAVEDTELQDLYTDPVDLDKSVTLLYDPRSESAPQCPFCRAAEWNMVEVMDGDVPPPWQWAVTPS